MTAFAAAPAQAAVNRPYSMAYGASTAAGTIHFTDGRSATVNGVVHAVSTAKYVCAIGYNGSRTSVPGCSNVAYPGGANIGYSIPLTIDVAGGVQTVYVYLYDNPSGNDVTGVRCTRSSCSPA
jgi:hypothetical protein